MEGKEEIEEGSLTEGGAPARAPTPTSEKKKHKKNGLEELDYSERVERTKQLVAEALRRAEEDAQRMLAEYPDEDWSDTAAIRARQFRQEWDFLWGSMKIFGSFDKITDIPAMRYTDEPVPDHASDYCALQIISVKISQLRRGLQWPIHVYGLVAARDCVDHNRNIIFSRTRENCQTLTQQAPYLLLTGPSRSVVVYDSVYFEAVLKVKGSIESEDQDLSFLAERLTGTETTRTRLFDKEYTSKLSTLELTYGTIACSVEATITSVQVTDGSWPDGFCGRFYVYTSSLKEKKILMNYGDETMPVNADGMMMLSRRVVSVQLEGEELIVLVEAYRCNNSEIKAVEKSFTPKESGKSFVELDVGFCKLEVTVAWSLLALELFDDV